MNNMLTPTTGVTPALLDQFGRQVNYLRISVTDRCDFRCVYCMGEEMEFVPRRDILSLEEICRVAQAFTELGVRKIRLTGGEPLIRNNVVSLVKQLAQLPGLEQLAMTTNGSQLTTMATDLRQAGLTSLNISLDTLNPDRFKKMTRTGKLDKVLRGIDAARETQFEQLKLNAVIIKGHNEDEVLDLIEYARQQSLHISFIEEMPLGNIQEHDRELAFCGSEELHAIINSRYALTSLGEPLQDAGPSRYFAMSDSNTRVGFISPHSNNFCHLCNRVRLTAEGRLLLCLGNEHSVDLRQILRQPASSAELLKQSIVSALDLKPERHYFDLQAEPQILRFMNATGG